MVSIASAVPSLKTHAVAVQARDIRLHGQLAVRDEARDLVRHGGVRLIDGVVGVGHAIARRRPLQQPQTALEQPALHQPRQRDHLDGGENVSGREAHDEFGHEPVAAADAEEHLGAVMNGIGHDVGRGVAAAHHQHTPVAHLRGALVAARMQRLACERAGIGRHARRIVMPARHHHAAIEAGLGLAGDCHLPQFVAARRDIRYGLAELDVRSQPEGTHKVAEVAEHALMARILGIVLVQHRQVVEAGGADGGDRGASSRRRCRFRWQNSKARRCRAHAPGTRRGCRAGRNSSPRPGRRLRRR